MKKDIYSNAAPPPGPFDRRKKVRVSLAFYLVSIVVVALIVFILMLVQYLPGYRNSYRLGQSIKNSDVSMTVTIPMSEVSKRSDNPFTPKQKKEVQDTLKSMGARSATVDMEPETQTTTPPI